MTVQKSQTGQQSNQTKKETAEPAQSEGPEERSARVLIKTRPTIRPVLVWIAITIIVGAGIVTGISTNSEAIGGQGLSEILIQAVIVLAVLVLGRFGIRALILTRTTYEISDDYLRRQYTLLMRTRVQEVPTYLVRSTELRQSRIQKSMGYGSIAVNQGLGEIQFENIPQPYSTYEALSDTIEAKTHSDI